MARVRLHKVIDAPVSAVWDELARVDRHVEWMHDAVAIRFLTAQSAGVGTRFECDTRVGPLRTTDVMTITEWSPRRVMGVDHIGLVRGTGRFELRRARGGRTKLIWTEHLRFPRWLGGSVTGVVATPFLRRVWRRNLDALAARVELRRP
jgi:hypothetical protein